MSFKLLAIRPLDNCNKDFLKNLEENRIYKFYNDYSFKNINRKIISENDKSTVHYIKYVSNIPDNFYGQRDLKINISAIVGENGSGKSSIVELLYVAFYNFSIFFDILMPSENESPRTISDDEVTENIKIINDFFDFKSSSNRKDAEKSLKILQERIDLLRYLRNKNKHPKEKSEFKKIAKINVEFFFELNDKIYSLKFNNEKIYINEFIDKQQQKLFFRNLAGDKLFDRNLFNKFKKEDLLFYTLSINYSLYSLNSIEMGDWIENLFHKNDSYQTPIVLNPFRDEGNIDIKNETYLTKSRLLVNIIEEENLRKLNENKTISNINFSVDRKNKKLDQDFNSLFVDSERHLLFKLIHKIFIKDSNIERKELKYKIDIENYISNKLSSISNKYKKYYSYKNLFNIHKKREFGSMEKILENYFNLLQEDPSHITYKLKQAINFLYYGDYLEQKEPINLTIEELKLEIEKIKKQKLVFFPDVETIEIIPPSIFDMDYFFNGDSKNVFSKLSSGEKQKIFSFSTIIYHLRNIDSVKNEINDKELLIEYRNINLIFDEIELYYHPNFQKSFICNLLEYLDRANIKNIKNINCIFITHSPFILSDIPKQNVMFLQSGIPENFKRMNTFGANVTDLLADSFFIGDGLIGDFAKEKIEETISWLNELLKSREKINLLELDNKDSQNDSKISFQKNKIKRQLKDEIILNRKKNKFKNYFKIIQMIDEPFLRNKLEEMYFEATLEFPKKEILKKQISQMQEQLKKLNN